MRGLRWEILGNLIVVSLFAFLLTGIGVWFIHGKQMLEQSLLRRTAFLKSLEEEIENSWNGVLVGNALGQASDLRVFQELLVRCHERDPRLQLWLVDPHFRVKASSGPDPTGDLIKDKTLSMAFARRELCTSLNGTKRLFGGYQQAAFAVPLERGEELQGGILAYLSLEDVLSGSRQIVRFILFYLGSGTLVLLVFGTILISRTTVKPLEKMIRVVQRVAEGDLDQRVPVVTQDEMGQLALTFNQMAERLKAQQRALNEHVAALRRMNHELKQTQQEVIQSEKLASVGLLAAGLAHEIGNPLGAILGYIGMLERSAGDPQEQREYVKRAEKEVYRIHRIIKDLQEYSRPTPRRLSVLDVNRILQDTVGLVTRQREFREVLLELRLDEDRPAVYADAGQFQQVLVNLLLNAKDAVRGKGQIHLISRRTRFVVPAEFAATPPSRRNDDLEGVDFRLLRKDDPGRRWPFLESQELVEIEVKDNGAGIAPEHLQRVFDPFFTTKEVGKGTGLGLSVSQRIVESFHGDIRIETQLQEGTSVRVRLPIAETEAREETPKDEKECINC